ncbi:MAG: glycosyltransferase [Opitutales bacterium]
MLFCDVTFAYTPTSGGIRTYIDQKRKFLLEQTGHEHLLIVPGEEDHEATEGRLRTHYVHGLQIPGCEPYRFFHYPPAIRTILDKTQPDIIELGSFFTAPWPVFDYCRDATKVGKHCTVGGYFHTDLAEAYFATPIRDALQGVLTERSEMFSHFVEALAGFISGGVEVGFKQVFQHCDHLLAASEVQAARMREYGVQTVEVVPLGVDPELFHPRRREETLRTNLNIDPQAVLLLFAGRIDLEKRVDVLVEALEQLDTDYHLVLVGEGPLKAELEAHALCGQRLHLLPFESDIEAFAQLLASADIYVTAGPSETFGLSVIEAQASGLPVVGVEAGALVERVNESIGRLAEAGNAASFAACVRDVATQRKAMAQRSRAHVIDRGLDWNGTFRRLLEVYGASEPPAS